jgi:hypothetical protein
LEDSANQPAEAPRRRRRRSRGVRLRYAVERWLPLLLVGVAALLSAGVVRVMEVTTPPPGSAKSKAELARAPSALESTSGVKRPRSPDERVDLRRLANPTTLGFDRDAFEAVLRASVLDRGPGEPIVMPAAELEATRESGGELAPDRQDVSPSALAPLPEPGTLMLVASGIVWTTRGARIATPFPAA